MVILGVYKFGVRSKWLKSIKDVGGADQEFENAFVNKALYKQTELGFARMVLQELDKSLQIYGQFPNYETLETIEHVMPQTLNNNWKNYLGLDSEDPNLDRKTNSLGNLCLVSRPANSSAGQDSFENKKDRYSDVSALARDLKSRNVKWNLQSIKDRSLTLAKIGIEIWKW